MYLTTDTSVLLINWGSPPVVTTDEVVPASSAVVPFPFPGSVFWCTIYPGTYTILVLSPRRPVFHLLANEV